MLKALKLGRPVPVPSFSLSNSININHITRAPAPSSSLRFIQSAASDDNMDHSNKQTDDPQSKTVDSMSSFGEGYATRSDEEGFGGIYGGKQSLSKDDKDQDIAKNININHEFDHDQGSDVKEKEKARNQNKAAN